MSHLGGVRHNLPAGTEVRWDPQLTGIELVSTMGELTGGAEPTGDAALKRVYPYEELATPQVANAIFAAKAYAQCPGVVIGWAGSGEGQRMGRGVWRRPDRWVLYLVVTRKAGTVERGHEGLNLLDLIESYLGERTAVDGCAFSDQGVKIVGASRHSVTPTSFVYALTVETTAGVKRIDNRLTEGMSSKGPIADWDRTKYDVSVASTPEYPLIVDATYDQDP